MSNDHVLFRGNTAWHHNICPSSAGWSASYQDVNICAVPVVVSWMSLGFSWQPITFTRLCSCCRVEPDSP